MLTLHNSVESFFQLNYSVHLSKITDVSKSNDGKFFVNSEVPAWDFDGITKKLFPKTQPSSTDCVLFSKNNIFFVEFKSGLEKLVDWSNYDSSKIQCQEIGDRPCAKFGNLLRQRDEYKENMLQLNIQMKASDSYKTFEKIIIPQMSQHPSKHVFKYHLHFITVIDCKDIENDICEDIMLQMSDAKPIPKTNHITNIKSCLKRFARQDLWYDDIKVFGVQSFLDFLNATFPPNVTVTFQNN